MLIRAALLALTALTMPWALPTSAPASTASTAPEITYGEDGVTPVSVRAPLPKPGPALAKLSAAQREEALLHGFLGSFSPLSGALAPDYRIDSRSADKGGVHYRLRRFIGDRPVFGSESSVRLKGGEGLYLGRIRPVTPPAEGAGPALTAQAAIDRSLSDLATFTRVAPPGPDLQALLEETGPRAELVYFPGDEANGGLRLAWHVRVRANLLEAWEYVIDAGDGGVLLKYPVWCSAAFQGQANDLLGTSRSFGTWQHSGKYYLIDGSRPMFDGAKSVFPDKTVGAIVTMDMANTPVTAPKYNHVTSTGNTWTNARAVSAHYNAATSYEYYRTVHARNSINGLGGSILSFVNVADQDGSSMENAFWNGKAMFYGNGGSMMKPLAAAQDVAGHELTHGVIEATCGLRYSGQSGALNESLADIFGAMTDREDWLMAEDIVKDGAFRGGAMRNLADPHNGASKGQRGWQPAHMDEYQNLPLTQAGDNGGVHVNSGIPNRAYYLLATALGKEKAEQIYYRAMTRYLTASSKFQDMRTAVTESARDLYDSLAVKAAGAAFEEVGIKAAGPILPKRDFYPVNPGAEYVLLTKAGAGLTGPTLFVADSNFANPRPLTSTKLKSRPSATDDGTTALFVAADGRIIAVKTDPAAPQETVVDGEKVWELAAISKDGRRYAAVKSKADSSIYIGTMGVPGQRRFQLYNPTFEGTRTGGVVYAGTVDWDYRGNVVYDAYNSIRGDGGPITYWDVGFLRVWDDSLGAFADGTVTKLFSNLPDGVSIGNAAFARNSPDVVVYEYLDENMGSFSVRAMDMETRKTGVLANTTIISWPSYDKRDAAVAFNNASGRDTNVFEILLKADKISPSGTPRMVAQGYKWPVFLAKGTRSVDPIAARPTGLAGAMRLSASWDRASGRISLDYSLESPGPARLSILSPDGRVHKRFAAFHAGGAYRLEWTPERGATGLFFIRLEAGRQVRSTRILAAF